MRRARRGRQAADARRKDYVKHWDARIEADGVAHAITSPHEGEPCAQLKAAIADNGLGNRRLVSRSTARRGHAT